MLPRYRETRGMDYMRLDATRRKPARQPEAVAAGFEGQRNPGDRAAGPDRLIPPAMQQSKQPFWVRRQLFARLTLNAGKHAGNQPARVAQLDHGNDRAILVQADEGSAQVVRLGHRGTPSIKCSDEVAMPRRPPHSIYRSREGSDRSLDGWICWNREFPRCRLFRPGGAEVLRRNSGHTGGFEKGEF